VLVTISPQISVAPGNLPFRTAQNLWLPKTRKKATLPARAPSGEHPIKRSPEIALPVSGGKVMQTMWSGAYPLVYEKEVLVGSVASGVWRELCSHVAKCFVFVAEACRFARTIPSNILLWLSSREAACVHLAGSTSTVNDANRMSHRTNAFTARSTGRDLGSDHERQNLQVF
jgi:hypothetical protein